MYTPLLSLKRVDLFAGCNLSFAVVVSMAIVGGSHAVQL